MKTNVYSASDYAGMVCDYGAFYYGYEVTTEDEHEWCFEAKVNGEITKIPFSELGVDEKERFDCQACLLYGIGKFLNGKR